LKITNIGTLDIRVLILLFMRSLLFIVTAFCVFSCSSKPAETSLPHSADSSALKNPKSSSVPDQIATDTTGLVVYVTHDGDKYHTADCRYAKSGQLVKLSQAKADGKTACDRCKPNAKTGEKQIRCSAKTKEGKQCQRMTTDASGKCFQHKS
jgi:hypothetical protein